MFNENYIAYFFIEAAPAKRDCDVINQNCLVGIEVLTTVGMNIALFWDRAVCSPYVN
jgi:hypothetical protein